MVVLVELVDLGTQTTLALLRDARTRWLLVVQALARAVQDQPAPLFRQLLLGVAAGVLALHPEVLVVLVVLIQVLAAAMAEPVGKEGPESQMAVAEAQAATLVMGVTALLRQYREGRRVRMVLAVAVAEAAPTEAAKAVAALGCLVKAQAVLAAWRAEVFLIYLASPAVAVQDEFMEPLDCGGIHRAARFVSSGPAQPDPSHLHAQGICK